MEKIHQLTLGIKTHWPTLLLITLACVLLIFVRLQAESYAFGAYNDDEYHTIYQGIHLITDGNVENFRAQESVRWLVRLFYPTSIIYMNTHMGGNVYIDGWEYSGHNYIGMHFIHPADSSLSPGTDPTLRLLFHALRGQYIFFVALCITLFAFLLSRHYKIAGIGLVALLGLSLELITEQKIFYLEPGIVASLALFLSAYLYALVYSDTSRRFAILFGVLGAFMVSTKFSTVLFALLPVILYFYLSGYRLAFKQIGTYVLSAVLSYLVINFPAFLNLHSVNRFLHDLSSNFWQYAAGSEPGITVASGITHLSLLTYQLEGFFGYALYLLPLCIAFALWYAHPKERWLLTPVLAISLISIYSLSKQSVYVARNLIPFYLPLAVVVLVSIEIIFKTYIERGKRTHAIAGIVILCVLWGAGVVAHAGGISSFASTLIPDTKSGFVHELRTLPISQEGVWYTVGFDKNFFAGEFFASKLQVQVGAPSVVHSKNYPQLESRFASLPHNSVVLIHNTGNNKHLTTYILPKYFNKNIQTGNYFAFFNVE